MKYPCGVVGDLMPLLAEDALSEESKLLVREHFEECEACRTRFENADWEVKTTPAEGVRAKRPFQKIKRRHIWMIAAAVFVTFLLSGIGITYFTSGWPGFYRFTRPDEILANDEFTGRLAELVSAGEGWELDKIVFGKEVRTSSYSRQGDYELYRWLDYGEERYLCIIKAKETFLGVFELEGYEFAVYNQESNMYEWSNGGMNGTGDFWGK